MKKLLFALLLLPAVAWASCDLTLTMNVSDDEGPRTDSSITYRKLPAWAADDVMKKGISIVDTANKQADKKGVHTVVLGGTNVCDGKATPIQELGFEGVTLKGLAAILRQSAKVGEELIKLGEQADAKGKKKAWHHTDKKGQ